MSPKADACPLCGKRAVATHTPFCSQGCKDRDLLNWLDGAYAAPAAPDEEDAASWEQDEH